MELFSETHRFPIFPTDCPQFADGRVKQSSLNWPAYGKPKHTRQVVASRCPAPSQPKHMLLGFVDMQLHCAPTQLLSPAPFLPVLRRSVLGDHPSAFIACNCNSYSKRALSSPCQRCLNKMKLSHCSFHWFQTCFLKMFPPFTRNHHTSVSVAKNH